MNKAELKDLQGVIMGQHFDEALINKAITFSDTLEVKVCLTALKTLKSTFESRMVLQTFVCRLTKKGNKS
jgi:hypothetical protein